MSHEFQSNSSELVAIDDLVRHTHPYCAELYEHQLPRSFDLSFLRQHIDDLYNFKPGSVGVEVAISDDNHRDSTNVERGSYLYLDPADGTVKSSHIMSGDYRSVRLDFSDYEKKGGLPLMQIHTHPVQALFSPADYSALLTTKNGVRHTKSALVLCPETQILAVTTPATPKLDMDQSYELISEWKGIFHERIGEIIEKENRVREYLSGIGWSDDLVQARDQEYHSMRKASANRTLVEFSRLVNIKMYTSDNRQHFQEAC